MCFDAWSEPDKGLIYPSFFLLLLIKPPLNPLSLFGLTHLSVDSFVYLGSLVKADNSTSQEVQRRIMVANVILEWEKL